MLIIIIRQTKHTDTASSIFAKAEFCQTNFDIKFTKSIFLFFVDDKKSLCYIN